MRILIVDDEPDIGGAISIALRKRGHECHVLGAAHEALELLGREQFDLILCDLVMPQMNGAELFEKLKADGNPAVDRMIFISANAEAGYNQTFLERTGRPWLQKPFSLAELSAFIDENVK